MAARPACIAALLAIARQRCVRDAAFFASSFTMERSHASGTMPETPSSVAWRTTWSIFSPFAMPCKSTTCGRAGASSFEAMRTVMPSASKETTSHSK